MIEKQKALSEYLRSFSTSFYRASFCLQQPSGKLAKRSTIIDNMLIHSYKVNVTNKDVIKSGTSQQESQ